MRREHIVSPACSFPPPRSFAAAGLQRTITLRSDSPGFGGAGQNWYIYVETAAAVTQFTLSIAYFDLPSPAPTPGALQPIGLATPSTFVGLPQGRDNFYVFSFPAGNASVFAGLVFRLTSTAGSDADLYVSTVPPRGAVFTINQALTSATGGADSVTIVPPPGLNAAYW